MANKSFPNKGYRRKEQDEGLNLDIAFKHISPLLNMKDLTTEQIAVGVEEIRKCLQYAGSDSEFTTHQIRNIYTMIKNCKDHGDLIINRPRLAYLGIRQKTKSGKKIVELVDKLIQAVVDDNQLRGLVYIVESMVAYHKFYSKAN